MGTNVQKTSSEVIIDSDLENDTPSFLMHTGNPSTSSTSPQYGSPDSQEPYHPPSPATSSECFLSTSTSSLEIEFSQSAPDDCLSTLYRVGSAVTVATEEAESNETEDSQLPPGQGTPADTQDDEGEKDEDDGGEDEDEFDGWVPSGFIKVVKTAVIHLLNETIKKFMTDCCYGCSVDHPSLRQHQCMDVLEDDFFHDHYYGLMRRLYNQRFIGSIQHLLTARNICEDDGRVRAVAEAYLYELTLVKQINTSIHDMYEQLIGEDVKKWQQLQTMTKFWEG